MEYKIVKKGERFYLIWVDGNGKKRQKLCKNASTKKQANLFLRKFKLENEYLISNITKEMYVPGSEHVHRLQQFGKKLSPETLYQKRYHIKLFSNEFGNYDIRELKIKDIELFLMKDKKHSASYKNNVLDSIATVYDETVWKCQNPVPRPKFQRFIRNSKKADVLTVEELKKLLDIRSWENYEQFLIFNLIGWCGLRIGEVRALRPCQFLFENKVLVIDGFCKTDGARTNYNKKGSDEDRKIRIVPLSNYMISILLPYINSKKIKPDSFLFQRQDGTPKRKETLEHIFKRALMRSGIKSNYRRLIPHSLRYTYVTIMCSKCEKAQVQKIAGHSSIQMTDYYNRFNIKTNIASIKDSFKAVNEFLK